MVLYFNKKLNITESSRVTSVELDNDLYLKDVGSSSTAVAHTMDGLPALNAVMIKMPTIFTETDAVIRNTRITENNGFV